MRRSEIIIRSQVWPEHQRQSAPAQVCLEKQGNFQGTCDTYAGSASGKDKIRYGQFDRFDSNCIITELFALALGGF